jgi:hypothetical protein
MRDEKQKIRYQPIIEFTSKNIRDRFSDQVIAALKLSHPEAFAEDGTP